MKKWLRSLWTVLGAHRRFDAARTRHTLLRVSPVPVLTTGRPPAQNMSACNDALFDPARARPMDCGAEPDVLALDATSATHRRRLRLARPTRLGVLR